MPDDLSPAKEFARRVRARAGQACRAIILFGSRARNTARSESDYDVMILVDQTTDELRRLIQDTAFETALDLDCVFSPLVFDLKAYESDRYEPLFVNVRREGVAL